MIFGLVEKIGEAIRSIVEAVSSVIAKVRMLCSAKTNPALGDTEAHGCLGLTADGHAGLERMPWLHPI